MDPTTGTSFGAAIENVFTRGLDAAAKYYTTRLVVNDPTPSVTGPNGVRVPVGQSAAAAPGVAGVPSWVWIGGAALLGVVVVVTLLKR